MAVKPKAGDVVGRGAQSTPSPKPTVKANPLPNIMPSANPSNLGNAINNKLSSSNLGFVLTTNSGSMGPHALQGVESYTPSQLTSIGILLKKFGVSVKATKDSVKTALMDPAFAGIVAQSPTYADLINNLNKNYLPGLDSSAASAASAANLPSRSVYQYKPEDIYDIVNSVYKTTLGREATDAEKKQQYEKLKPSINAGTLTTTAKVKNPKTGKMEVVTTQTPGFSQKTAEANIAAGLQKTNADEATRQKALNFSSDLSKILGGGM